MKSDSTATTDSATTDSGTTDSGTTDSGTTDSEWRERLTDEQYRVTRRAGTERPFSSPLCGIKEPGVYCCVCCGAELFRSETKYDSGTGWPSFHAPVSADAVREKNDFSLFSKRTEILCSGCDAHLGHVFPDGPPPSGRRYCMNGVALTLKQGGGDSDSH